MCEVFERIARSTVQLDPAKRSSRGFAHGPGRVERSNPDRLGAIRIPTIDDDRVEPNVHPTSTPLDSTPGLVRTQDRPNERSDEDWFQGRAEIEVVDPTAVGDGGAHADRTQHPARRSPLVVRRD